MKRKLVVVSVLTAALLALVLAVPVAAFPDNPASMNARFMHFQEKPEVIHLLVFQDDGRLGVPAVVSKGQPLLFGVEWTADTVEELQATIADSVVTLSVDGNEPLDVSDYYLPAFWAETQSGPAWSWDHDGDGPGDGDGDGIGDWSGLPITFYRYPHRRMDRGLHTFAFWFTFAGVDYFDEITVLVR